MAEQQYYNFSIWRGEKWQFCLKLVSFYSASQEKLVRVQVLHTIHKTLFLTVEKEHWTHIKKKKNQNLDTIFEALKNVRN